MSVEQNSNYAAVSCSSASDTFSIKDDTNYRLSLSPEIQSSVLKDATNLVFDWGDLKQDMFGKSLDPAQDIDLVVISGLHLTPSAIETAIATDNLPVNANVGALTTYPDGTYTSKHLLEFDSLGNPLPESDIWKYFDTKDPGFQYPQDEYTFIVMADTGTTPAKNNRTLSLFTIDPNATQTTLKLTNDSTKLGYDVDLLRARPIAVPAGVASLNIEWGDMRVNALGNEYVGQQITEAAVAHFATNSIAELSKEFLRLDVVADGWWSGEILSGTSVDLSELVNKNGSTFPGVTSDGIWAVALFCTYNCNNPAPWSITFLKACG